MSKQLQLRVDDLAESLLVAELEMRRSWNVETRIAAYRDFGRIMDSIDVLRRDAEELHAKDDLLRPLDRKAASIMRSQPYRIAEWFLLYSDVRWYVGQTTIDPVQHVTQC
jgi:hypothetical protein